MEHLIVRQLLYPAFLTDYTSTITSFSDQYAFRPSGSTTAALNWILLTTTQLLPNHDCVTDLGVMYDNHLSVVPHLNKTVNKASQRANLILRCFTTRDPAVLIKAFNTFVRPVLEYAHGRRHGF